MDNLKQMEAEMLAQMEEMPELYIEENQKFIIDNKLRTITMPSSITLGVESDDDVNRLHFQMPQKLGDVDLSKFDIYINYMNANNEGNIYIVEDKAVAGGNITFSWLVGRSATKYKGDTKFIVCMKLCDGRGVVQQEFNTTVVSLKVLEGLEIENPVIDQGTSDTITQLLNIVKNTSEKAVKDVQQEGTTQAGLITKEGEKQLKVLQTAAQAIEVDRQQIQTNKTDITALTQSKADAIINTATGEHIVVSDSSEHLFDNLKIYGKSTQSGTPTPDVPVPIVSTGDKGQIEITVHGKQLFEASKLPSKTAGGATVTNNGDGSFTISGIGNLTSAFTAIYTLNDEQTKKLLKVGTIAIKNGINKGIYFEAGFKSPLGNKYLRSGSIEINADYLNSITKMDLLFYGENNAVIPKETCKPMIYQDGEGTWESFAPLQSLSIPTPDGLYGIPVESDGNYTDSKGQQWICDEIDIKKGIYIQRIKKDVINEKIADIAVFDKLAKTVEVRIDRRDADYEKNKKYISNKFKYASATWGVDTPFICSIGGSTPSTLRFAFRVPIDGDEINWFVKNPTEIMYVLKKPIETSIQQEELAKLRALHSNYPSTVVQNNADADMELSYVADTKNYTDNKIKEAVSAQIQNTANLLSLMPLSTQATMIENDTNNILDNMEVTKNE